MKEKDSYRENLERLDELFPNKELLKRTEVAKALGVHRTVIEVLPFKELNGHYYISKVSLAKAIS